MIRNALIADVEAINSIYNYEVLNSTVTFDEIERSYEDAVKWFQSHNQGNHPIFVYEQDHTVVGYCSLSTYRTLDAFNATAEISLYIHKDYRAQGIGRQLCQSVIQYAQARSDLHNIVAVITSDNEKSLNLFKSLAFKDGGTIPQTGKKFGKYLSITNLYKII